MGSISGKINLAALTHAVMPMGKDKVECIVIPIAKNNLFKSDKGNVYLDLQAFEIAPEKRNDDRKDTHIVSQSLPKEVREKLKEANQYPPTLGNLIDWDQVSGGGEPSPNVDPFLGESVDLGSDKLPWE